MNTETFSTNPASALSPRTDSATSKGNACPLCKASSFRHVRAYTARHPVFQNKSVVSCQACGLIYANPMPIDEELKTYYQGGGYWDHNANKTQLDIPTFHHRAKARLDFILSHAALANSPKILDIGAGFGVMEKILIDRYPGTPHLFAVEPDAKALAALTAMGVTGAPELERFRSQKFDLIILSHVLEHMIDPVAYLKGLSAYIGGESRLFIEVPHQDHDFKIDLEPHLVFFSPETLASVLKTAGYEIAAIDTCGNSRDKQRRLEKETRRRARLLSLLPFKPALRQLKKKLANGSSVSVATDPFSHPDTFETASYGGDRMWIRCLARYKGAA